MDSDLTIHQYDNNMKSSNTFVWKGVEEIDDGHIHASTAAVVVVDAAAAAVEMNTTSVFICVYVED